MMLCKLLSRLDRTKFEPIVFSLTDAGPMADKIRSLSVAVHSLGLRRRTPNPFRLLRLVRWLREWRPDVVQTWMYHADLAGGIAARHAKVPVVVWNIRHSDLDLGASKRRTIWVAGLCARLSKRIPDRIVCCSEASRKVHASLGYNQERMVVIPNGFDVGAYLPDPELRKTFRKTEGIPANAFVVGHVARYDPQKDHRTFLLAASRLAQEHKQAIFVLCGDGVTATNPDIRFLIETENLQGRVHLLGPRNDMPKVYPAFDLLVSSSSFGEGFPNVIGEAMASQVPCVVTDVGDSALIVGETGFVVPPRSADSIAEAMAVMLMDNRNNRVARGVAARKRVIKEFELSKIVERYEQLYQEYCRNGF